jgi:hypothetical protein
MIRPAFPWTTTLHGLFRHFEDVGFTGAPKVVGDGFDSDGHETLIDPEGIAEYPHAWSDEGIWNVGRLLRELHKATSSFRPVRPVWQPWWMHDDSPGCLIGHCDAGPWHTVAQAGRPIGFVNWELAGPVDRLDEVAATALWNAYLRDDDIAQRYDLPDVTVRARQVELFLDGYELPMCERKGMITRMIEFAIRDCAAEAVMAGITPESTDPAPLWALAWRARAAAWIIRHRAVLERNVRGSTS